MSRNPFRWKQLRAEKLRNNPICEVCETNDLSTLATEVHHKIPVESVPRELGMRQLMFDYNNLQSLCHACHSEIHRCAFSHSKEAIQSNNRRATERFVEKFLK